MMFLHEYCKHSVVRKMMAKAYSLQRSACEVVLSPMGDFGFEELNDQPKVCTW